MTSPAGAADTARSARGGGPPQWLPAGLALATVLAQILYPLISGAARDVLTVLTVLLFAGASVTSAWRAGGGRFAGLLLLVTVAVGFLAEAIGVATGVPFGSYSYAGSLGPRLLGVPVIIPLAWTMMAYPALVVGRRCATGVGPRIAVSALALASWDVFLDPQMVDAGHWKFAAGNGPTLTGIPLVNFAGWLLVALLLMALLHAVLPAPRPRSSQPGRRDRAPGPLSMDLRLIPAGQPGLLRPASSGTHRGARDGRADRAAAAVAGPTVSVAGASGVRRAGRRLLRAASVALACHTLVNSVLLRVPPTASTVPERVSVLLPVRNEAARIRPTLAAVLASRLVPNVEVVVLDDASSDGTAEIVAAVAGADERVRLIRSHDEPPSGWLGKPWACARLADLADRDSSVLVFLDADVRLAPDGLARTIRLLREAELGFVSPYPRQVVGTPAEWLVQPLLQWSWLTFLPLRLAEHTSRPSMAVANGQLLAVDAALYRRSGGHRAVPGAVLEDVALARVLRAAGGHGGMADGTAVSTCRMYDGWAEVRGGYAKSLWATAGGSPVGSAAQVLTLLALYCRPDLVSYGAGALSRAVAARRTGGRAVPDALAHPLSIATFAYLTGLSWYRHRQGRLSWKDRPLV
jgi:hypothetical protein